MSRVEERREFQRIDLRQPIDAMFGAIPVRVVDLGILGARVEHGDPLEVGQANVLRFSWNGDVMELEAAIVRSVPRSSSQFQSGMKFFTAIGRSDQTLRRLLANLVTDALGRRETSISEDEEPAVRQSPEEFANAPYIAFHFDGGEWKRRGTNVPKQPSNGFTVAAGADEVEIKRLCLEYAIADTEGRRLVKLFAELSISQRIGVPPRRE